MGRGRTETVAEQLLGSIVDGTFAAGSALPSELDLAGRFGVSRLTVREAIRSLAPTGVLDVRQGRSTVVAPAERWSALDGRLLLARSRAGGDPLLRVRRLLEARGAVELAIVELAAQRRTPEHLDRLRSAHAAMLRAHDSDDVAAVTEADLAFHDLLFDAADNVFLNALFEPLSSAVRALRAETSSVPGFRRRALDHHAAVLAAVEAGDPQDARQAMRAHLEQTGQDLERHFGPLPETGAPTGPQPDVTPNTSSIV